eukprot:CAMPEP_0177759978 /NCGR_PEP_ID=MMETSP0491_2-20121128/5018_1 /TAXON_ID=63592 /ORGANISM="Tetraselmis chuii, Strain PLY429" /LENGTH=58 /DNA_ID=CAMNT_0019275839 /DNA_START=1311 /DNA_END=1484 /DNA_ORIENTATION=-
MRQSVLQQSSSQIVGEVHDAAFAEVVVGREVEAAQLPAVDQGSSPSKVLAAPAVAMKW